MNNLEEPSAQKEATAPAKPVRLLPVIYLNSDKRQTTHEPERAKCLFLLKALRVTQDPKRLAQMMGVKRVAEVYRTLDKLAMRKEYHGALSRAGIDFDYIVRGFKDAADHAPKYADRVTALKAILKSVGMDEYKETESGGGGGWEEVLAQKIEETKQLQAGPVALGQDYEVIAPPVPPGVKMLSPSSGSHG